MSWGYLASIAPTPMKSRKKATPNRHEILHYPIIRTLFLIKLKACIVNLTVFRSSRVHRGLCPKPIREGTTKAIEPELEHILIQFASGYFDDGMDDPKNPSCALRCCLPNAVRSRFNSSSRLSILRCLCKQIANRLQPWSRPLRKISSLDLAQ
jgi:hypothetical protein